MYSVEEVLILEDWAENPKKGSKDIYEILD